MLPASQGLSGARVGPGVHFRVAMQCIAPAGRLEHW
jgi:hypothetical protein